MIKEIESYIVRNYNELQTICLKITKHSQWSDDLLQDVLCQLYEKETINIKTLDDASIKFYIVRCLTNNWYSKTSPFFRKVMRESTLYNELGDVSNIATENNEEQHILMDTLEQEFMNLNWFHKDVFSRFMVLGSLKKVSDDTTIPYTSIKRYVKEAKNEIKLNTFKKIKDE